MTTQEPMVIKKWALQQWSHWSTGKPPMVFKTSRYGWGSIEKAKLFNSRAEARRAHEWDSTCAVVPVLLAVAALPTPDQSAAGLRAS